MTLASGSAAWRCCCGVLALLVSLAVAAAAFVERRGTARLLLELFRI